MDRIAEVAGASKRTVYNHFESKEDLFGAAVERFMDQAAALKEIPYDPDRGLEEQLGDFADAKMKLADRPDWDRQKIDGVIEGGEITTVHLATKLPVLLLYWTAEVDPEGNVRFYSDVYDRDAGLLEALDSSYSGS